MQKRKLVERISVWKSPLISQLLRGMNDLFSRLVSVLGSTTSVPQVSLVIFMVALRRIKLDSFWVRQRIWTTGCVRCLVCLSVMQTFDDLHGAP